MKKKQWYKSKTILGLLLAIAGSVLTFYGADPQIFASVSAIAAGYGIYGRVSANTEIQK